MKVQQGIMKNIEMFFLVMFICSLVVSVGITSHVSKDTVTFTVTEKERVVVGEDSYYLVFDGKGAFKNVDDIWQLKFDSSTLYSQLKVGKTYTCYKNFWRVPIFSMYENLISCEEVVTK